MKTAFDADAPGAQFRQDGFVVDEVARNGERRVPGGFPGQGDGVLDPEHLPKCSARMIFMLFGAAVADPARW